MAGEKTEKATPKRKKDERKKGNIVQSKDVVAVISLLVMFYSLEFFLPFFADVLKYCLNTFIQMAATMEVITLGEMNNIYIEAVKSYVFIAAPMLLISMIVSVGITAMQTKLLFTIDSLKFKGSRINPLEGMKKLVSLRSLVELFKSMIKISVLGYIIYSTFKKHVLNIPKVIDMPLEQAVAFLIEIIMSIVSNVGIIFAFIAIIDYGYQWWEYEKNLKMSKQDIKDEYKQSEGDPQVRQKIKEKQREQAMSRMMQGVPSADIVIRNPTHYAIALKYDPKSNSAPIVIAKGADLVAFRIIAVAEENNIPITENKPLARGLYDAVELNMEVPEEFYQPVAEVLAFVYSLKKKKDLK